MELVTTECVEGKFNNYDFLRSFGINDYDNAMAICLKKMDDLCMKELTGPEATRGLEVTSLHNVLQIRDSLIKVKGQQGHSI